MGYTSDVRIVMTKKCWDYVKENAPKIYASKLSKYKTIKEDDETLTTERNGIHIAYYKNSVKEMLEHPEIFKVGVKSYAGYVMIGWDCIKWLGYNFDDANSITQAIEDSGEPARMVLIGEDNMTDEQEWGDYYEDARGGYDAPLLEATSQFDYGDDEWEDKANGQS